MIIVLIALQMERKEAGTGAVFDFPNGFDIFANAFLLSQCVRSLLRTHNTNLPLAPLRPLKLKKGNTLLSGLLLQLYHSFFFYHSPPAREKTTRDKHFLLPEKIVENVFL